MAEIRRLYDEVTKKPAEEITYVIPWWLYLQRLWYRGERFAMGAYVRPSRPNGFEYECTTAGQSGAREPQWPTTVAATVQDGSAVWTCRAIGNSAIDTMQTSAWSEPDGLTVSDEDLNATKQETSARIVGGTDGQCYDVENTIVTATGDTYVYDLKVKVEAY